MSKIALPIAELKPALNGLGKINRKSTLPVLNHIKVERTTDGWIALTASSLDQCATVRLEQPTEGGACAMLVPYDSLQKTVKACSKGDVIALEDAGEIITIHYPIGQQSAQTRVETLKLEEFPSTPRIKGDSIPLPDSLRSSIHEAFECASDDPTRYVLNGAFINVTEPSCHHVVATNGRMLYSSNSFSLPLGKSLLIPIHPFLAWKEFNSDGEWQLRVDPDDKESDPPPFQISSRRWRFISKQIDGNYPNWRQVVPSSDGFATTVVLEEKTLESIVQIIQRLPEHDTTNHTVGLKVNGKEVSLLGKSPGADAWTEVFLNLATAKGKDVTIFINREFFSSGLKFGLNTIEITDCMSPLRMSKGGRQLIIMPVRAEVVTPAKPAEEATTPVTAEAKPAVPSTPATPTATSPTAPAPATSTERSSMITDPTTTTTTTPPTEEQAPASDLDQILETIEDLRESLTTNLGDLKTVAGKLKQIKKEQKTTEREVQNFRQTLKTLQGVKL